jgi:hypothetical protein
MKKVILLMLFTFVFIVLFSQEKNTNGTEYIKSYSRNEPNRYENEKFSFHDYRYYTDSSMEGLKALPYQLPEELLSDFTAEELFFFCLDHPFLRYRKKDYFDRILSFNGLQELITRQEFLEAFRKNIVQFITEVIELQKRKVSGFTSEDEMRRNYLFSNGFVFFISETFYDTLNEDLKSSYKKTLNQISEDLKNETEGYYYYPFLQSAMDNDVQLWLLSEFNQTPVRLAATDDPHRGNSINFSYKSGPFLFPIMRYNELTLNEISNLPYQLPHDLLSEITTEELYYYTEQHPILRFGYYQNFIKAYGGYQEWQMKIQKLLLTFNGFQELLKRNDLIEVGINFLENDNGKERNDSPVSFFQSKLLYDSMQNMQKIELLEYYLKTINIITVEDGRKFKALFPDDNERILAPIPYEFRSTIGDPSVYEIDNDEALEKFRNLLQEKIQELKGEEND